LLNSYVSKRLRFGFKTIKTDQKNKSRKIKKAGSRPPALDFDSFYFPLHRRIAGKKQAFAENFSGAFS